MTEMELAEVEKANDLFKQAQAMIKEHLAGNALWDAKLFNHMVIQLQEAWPIAYAAISDYAERPKPLANPTLDLAKRFAEYHEGDESFY